MSGMLWCSNFKLMLLPLIRCLELLYNQLQNLIGPFGKSRED